MAPKSRRERAAGGRPRRGASATRSRRHPHPPPRPAVLANGCSAVNALRPASLQAPTPCRRCLSPRGRLPRLRGGVVGNHGPEGGCQPLVRIEDEDNDRIEDEDNEPRPPLSRDGAWRCQRWRGMRRGVVPTTTPRWTGHAVPVFLVPATANLLREGRGAWRVGNNALSLPQAAAGDAARRASAGNRIRYGTVPMLASQGLTDSEIAPSHGSKGPRGGSSHSPGRGQESNTGDSSCPVRRRCAMERIGCQRDV